MWALAISIVIGGPSPPPGLRAIVAPRDAAQVAWLDLSANVPRDRQAYQFYVWNNAGPGNIGTLETAATLNFLMNAVLSQSGTIIDPTFVYAEAAPIKPEAKAKPPLLLRYDLKFLLADPKKFERVWDELQKLAEVEPYFHQPSSYDSQHHRTFLRDGSRAHGVGDRDGHDQASRLAGVEWIKVPIKPYKASDGQVYDYEWKRKAIVRRVEFGLHAGAGGPLSLLSDEAGHNLLPIVRGDWWVATAWDSQTINGVKGSYYQLSLTGETLDEFLEQAGADAKLIAKLGSDQRTAMISEVTDKWRQIEAFYGSGVRPEVGPSLITVTHDIANKDSDAKRHAYLNLLAFLARAKEAIAAKRNGLHAFILTNGDNKRQDAAPPDVAAWPGSPHKTKELTCGISCIECHGQNRGYNPTENLVREGYALGFAPIADLTFEVNGKRLNGVEVQQLLRDKYDGELNLPLREAGNAYAKAVDRATWGLFGERCVERVSAETVRLYREYHERVAADRLLHEIGFELVDAKAVRAAAQRLVEAKKLEPEALLVKDDHALALATIVPPAADEDGRIGLARRGKKLKRGDVHEVFFEMALRAIPNE